MGSAEFGIIALNPSASHPKTAWEEGPHVGHTMPVFLEVSEQVLGRVFTASKHPASEPDSQSLCDSQGTTSILGPRAGPRPTPCTTSPRGGPGGCRWGQAPQAFLTEAAHSPASRAPSTLSCQPRPRP